ncbi:hypothetical protein CK203_060287 [Vitis vinifera]|uniref:Uncharacterized protein n=1 Tax=Vitis vinifera TaxID=29760 RepID=A0A438GDL1_VITVI|nr:hypothetical protein CK203_060287 [Vitis vinifera]
MPSNLFAMLDRVADWLRKQVYRYPNLRFFSVPACFYVVIVFMSSVHAFLLSSRWGDGHDSSFIIGQETCFASFDSQIRLAEGLNKVDRKILESGTLDRNRPVAVLSKQKFQARFHIMDTILIQLTNGEALFSANLPNYMMYFTKECPKSFIILMFPWLTPSSLVLGEHFVLKDLPFYEVARLADSEAR